LKKCLSNFFKFLHGSYRKTWKLIKFDESQGKPGLARDFCLDFKISGNSDSVKKISHCKQC